MNIRKIENGEKVCGSCKVLKPLDQFYKDNAHKLIAPYRSKCKDCERNTAREWRANNKEYVKQIKNDYNHQLRQDLLNAFGRVCSCCGETNEEFLTLEHKLRTGGKHRKEKSHQAIHVEIRRLGYPEELYTLLCMNCNFATRMGGICPHKKNQNQKI